MPTIDTIVEQNLNLVFKSRHIIMGRNGFDYQFLLSCDISKGGKDYSQPEATKIGMIANELVLNAIKAIYGVEEPHKASNIDELKEICGRVEFRAYEDDGTYVLSCQDNGCGIPEESKQRVFDNGFSTRGTSGIGLGMIGGHIRDLGGRIYFDSEFGKGTTFYVELPK